MRHSRLTVVLSLLLIASVYPDLTPRQLEVPLAYINASLGLQLDTAAVTKLLHSMQLDVAPEPSSSSSSSGPVLTVRVPPTRSDILHACDVMEDVAIAYGYNNLQQQVGCGMLL
jgi:phenylalanyl-tRNA synthetase beta chain